MKCKICGKEIKRLKYHMWRSHTDEGKKHRPGPFKGRTPWNKGKEGSWNKGLTKLTSVSVAQRSLKMIGRKVGGVEFHSEETKLKIAIASRGNTKANHRGKKTIYNGIKMDSSWEAGVAKYLDNNNIKWQYAPVAFKLDERRSYRPDFILECGKIIEVKGYWRNDNKIKFDEWRSKYPHLVVEVWDKNVLRNKNIINSSGYLI